MSELEITLLLLNPMVWLFIAFVIFGVIDLILVASTCYAVTRLVKGIIKGNVVLKVDQIDYPKEIIKLIDEIEKRIKRQ